MALLKKERTSLKLYPHFVVMGGDLICCHGKSLMAFHGTVNDVSDSAYHSLEFLNEEVEEIEIFKCKNCQYNQRKCYVGRKLGSSDESASAQLFQYGRRTGGYLTTLIV